MKIILRRDTARWLAGRMKYIDYGIVIPILVWPLLISFLHQGPPDWDYFVISQMGWIPQAALPCYFGECPLRMISRALLKPY